MKTKKNNHTIDSTSALNIKNESELSWSIRPGAICEQKTKQDNDVTDRMGVVYIEKEIELSWLIGQGAICDEIQAGQWRDWSYRSSLLQNRNWIVVTYLTWCGLWWKLDRTTTWLIVQVWYLPKKNWVVVTDRIDAVYDQNQTKQWPDSLYRRGLCRKLYLIVKTYRTRCGLHESKKELQCHRSYKCVLC